MQNPEQSAAPTDFPAYPAYKPSGVEWLGDIPAHWDTRPLKYSAKTIMGQSPSGYDCDETPIGPPFLQGCAEFQERHPKPVLYCRAPKKISPAGAILMSVRAPVGRLNIADQEYAIGRGLCAIIPDHINLDTTFAYYHLQAITTGLRLASTGSIFDAVRLRDVRNQPIITPPLPEQRAIAAYLDRKGAIARRYAHVARHIIDTLRELRQVEIHDAVTRGLNEDIPLKPSGVEWLGDVPEHWDVRRLKYSAKTIMGQSPSGYDCDETPIGPPFLQGCAEFQERHPKPVLYCRAPKKISPAGAILMSVRAPVGRLNIADQEYAIGRGLCAIIPDHINLDTTFAYYHLQAITTGLRLASTGSIFDAVRLRDVRNQPIITPPLSEQRAIAEYLDAKTAAIDAAIAHYERMAELVAEYWTVLVADAVTGRIDLRQTAAE